MGEARRELARSTDIAAPNSKDTASKGTPVPGLGGVI